MAPTAQGTRVEGWTTWRPSRAARGSGTGQCVAPAPLLTTTPLQLLLLRRGWMRAWQRVRAWGSSWCRVRTISRCFCGPPRPTRSRWCASPGINRPSTTSPSRQVFPVDYKTMENAPFVFVPRPLQLTPSSLPCCFTLRPSSVASLPDGRFFASASFDKKVKLWCGKTGRFLSTLSGHVGSVYQGAPALLTSLISRPFPGGVRAEPFRCPHHSLRPPSLHTLTSSSSASSCVQWRGRRTRPTWSRPARTPQSSSGPSRTPRRRCTRCPGTKTRWVRVLTVWLYERVYMCLYALVWSLIATVLACRCTRWIGRPAGRKWRAGARTVP